MKYIAFIFLIASFFEIQQSQSVLVYHEEAQNGAVVIAKNSNYFPVTLNIKMDLTNVSSSRRNPITIVLPGRSQSQVAQLTITDKTKSWRVNYNYSYHMGSIFAKHDDQFAYRLPYQRGESYRLDQGFDGAFSHQGDGRYSLDFNMPEGSRVLAARAGKVIKITEKYNVGKNDPEFREYANHVSILHSDGTIGTYSHLKQDGVIVKLGDTVAAGQQIAFSGATGYVTGPHLHFSVEKAKQGGGYTTLPVKFRTQEGILMLEEGKTYTSY
jgi:murein DD-endopeptidase MepM/ murein hydrolase activator NlpD